MMPEDELYSAGWLFYVTIVIGVMVMCLLLYMLVRGFFFVCVLLSLFLGGGDVRGVVSLFCSVLKRVCNQEED